MIARSFVIFIMRKNFSHQPVSCVRLTLLFSNAIFNEYIRSDRILLAQKKKNREIVALRIRMKEKIKVICVEYLK